MATFDERRFSTQVEASKKSKQTEPLIPQESEIHEGSTHDQTSFLKSPKTFKKQVSVRSLKTLSPRKGESCQITKGDIPTDGRKAEVKKLVDSYFE